MKINLHPIDFSFGDPEELDRLFSPNVLLSYLDDRFPRRRTVSTQTKVKKRATFTVYRAKKGHSWRLKINGVIIAIAGEQFTRKRQAKRSIERLLEYTQKGRFKIEGDGPLAAPKRKR